SSMPARTVSELCGRFGMRLNYFSLATQSSKGRRQRAKIRCKTVLFRLERKPTTIYI
ncbi:hypothetical protein FRC09_019672, partial [Ceratobasidium sp. 395]